MGELSDRWRERVEAARREYERARLAAEQTMAAIDCDSTNDELEALTEAHRREAAALTEYMNVLRIFHQLKVKDEEPNT